MSLQSTISTEDLSARAADRRILVEGIALDVGAGERLAVIGPNGAGKSTLIKLLYGRLKPSFGRVLLGGRDLAAIPPAERAQRIAVVAQGDFPDLRLSLADYVDLGRIPHRHLTSAAHHRAIVTAAIAQVGLGKLTARRLETLSGGERQRAAIARALAQEPTLLILDEPTNHLDPRARADMLDLVRALGITVIAVLHDLALIGRFADRVAVIKDGRLIAHGPPETALTSQIVRDVFAMECFSIPNPVTGRPLLVFDTPPPN